MVVKLREASPRTPSDSTTTLTPGLLDALVASGLAAPRLLAELQRLGYETLADLVEASPSALQELLLSIERVAGARLSARLRLLDARVR